MENLISRYPALEACRGDIENALKLIIDTYKNGGKVLVCGNGGVRRTANILWESL